MQIGVLQSVEPRQQNQPYAAGCGQEDGKIVGPGLAEPVRLPAQLDGGFIGAAGLEDQDQGDIEKDGADQASDQEDRLHLLGGYI